MWQYHKRQPFDRKENDYGLKELAKVLEYSNWTFCNLYFANAYGLVHHHPDILKMHPLLNHINQYLQFNKNGRHDVLQSFISQDTDTRNKRVMIATSM